MRCYKCGYDTKVLDTRDLLSIQTTRRRECLNCGFRFTTTEVPTRAVRSNFAKGFAATAEKTIKMRERDIKIALEWDLGWTHHAQLYNLHRSAVHLARARGRKYLQLQRK